MGNSLIRSLSIVSRFWFLSFDSYDIYSRTDFFLGLGSASAAEVETLRQNVKSLTLEKKFYVKSLTLEKKFYNLGYECDQVLKSVQSCIRDPEKTKENLLNVLKPYEEVVKLAQNREDYIQFCNEYSRKLPGKDTEEVKVEMSESETTDNDLVAVSDMWKNADVDTVPRNTKWKKMSNITSQHFVGKFVSGLQLLLDGIDLPTVIAASTFELIVNIANVSLFQKHRYSDNGLQESSLQAIVLRLLDIIAACIGNEIEVTDATSKPTLYCWDKRVVNSYYKGRTDIIIYIKGHPLLLIELKTKFSCQTQLRQALLCGYSVEQTVTSNLDVTYQPLIFLMSAGATVVAQRQGELNDEDIAEFATYSSTDCSLTNNLQTLFKILVRLCASGDDADKSVYGLATPCKSNKDRRTDDHSDDDDSEKGNTKQKETVRRGLTFRQSGNVAGFVPSKTKGSYTTTSAPGNCDAVADVEDDVTVDEHRAYVVAQRRQRRAKVQHVVQRAQQQFTKDQQEAKRLLLPR
jgi:hypothetical protein